MTQAVAEATGSHRGMRAGSAPAAATPETRDADPGVRRSIRTGLTYFAAYRVVTLAVAVVGGLGANVFGLLRHQPSLLGGLFHHYDAVWFNVIADQGYASQGLAAFPPLFPLASRGVGAVLHINSLAAGMLVSSLCLAGALVVLHRLVTLQLGERTATTTLFLLLAWPSAVFLALPYAEAPFLLLLAGAFLAAQRRRWWLAGVCIGLAAMCKTWAALLTLAIAVEYMEARRWRWRDVRADAALLFVPTALAMGGWMLYLQHRFGQPLLFLTIEKQWGKRASFPWGGVEQGITNVLHSPERLVMSLDLLAIAIIAVAAVVAFLHLRRSYGVMLAIAGLAFTTTHDITSVSRFMADLFPVFILGALAARRWPQVLERLLAPAGFMAAGILLVGFAQDHWAGG